MSVRHGGLLALIVGVALLALIWWGWQRGGLGLLQLGMGAC